MNLMAIHIGIIINMLHYIINQLKNINITGSWLLYFYAGGNPMVNIYCVGTPERYGWDKSAVIHHLDWITGDLW